MINLLECQACCPAKICGPIEEDAGDCGYGVVRSRRIIEEGGEIGPGLCLREVYAVLLKEAGNVLHNCAGGECPVMLERKRGIEEQEHGAAIMIVDSTSTDLTNLPVIRRARQRSTLGSQMSLVAEV